MGVGVGVGGVQDSRSILTGCSPATGGLRVQLELARVGQVDLQM